MEVATIPIKKHIKISHTCLTTIIPILVAEIKGCISSNHIMKAVEIVVAVGT